MRTLAARVTLHSIAPVLAFALVLCVSAGTVRYWQAWAYVGLHFVTMMATNAYFLRKDPAILERRLALVENGEKDATQKVIIALIAVTTLAMLVVAGVDHRMAWSSLRPAVLVVAYLAVGGGVLVLFLVLRENRYGSSVIELADTQTVIETGPYRAARHPMYAGFLLVALATPLALGSYWAEILFVPLAGLLTVRLLQEERFLSERLQGYAAYMGKTRHRLIPGVW